MSSRKGLLALMLAFVMIFSSLSVVASDGETMAVAIGDVEYATIEEAIGAAKDGDVITLTSDVVSKTGVNVITAGSASNYTIDLGGHTLSLEKTLGLSSTEKRYITEENQADYPGYPIGYLLGTSPLATTVTVKNGKIAATSSSGRLRVEDSASLIVEDVSFTGEKTNVIQTYASVDGSRNVLSLTGCTFVDGYVEIGGGSGGVYNYDIDVDDCDFTITAGGNAAAAIKTTAYIKGTLDVNDSNFDITPKSNAVRGISCEAYNIGSKSMAITINNTVFNTNSYKVSYGVVKSSPLNISYMSEVVFNDGVGNTYLLDGNPVTAFGSVGTVYSSTKKYNTLAEAVAGASENDTITVLGAFSDEAVEVTKNLKITSNPNNKATLNNVSITAAGQTVDLTVENLKFTGASWIDANDSAALTVKNIEADVELDKEPNVLWGPTNSRCAFVALGSGEPTHGLRLIVEDSSIVVKGNKSPDPVLGWRYIADGSQIINNTFGSEQAVNFEAVKLMNFMNGANILIKGNTMYTNGNGIVLYQNCSRDNEYTAIVEDNTFIGDEVDYIWVQINKINPTDKFNGIILANSGNTVTANNSTRPFSANDIKLNSGLELKYYSGVDVEINEEGKIVGGQFNDTIGANIDDYLIEDYYKKSNGDGTYNIELSKATVVDAASSNGMTVEMEDLANNPAIDHKEDCTYKVVIDEVSSDDKGFVIDIETEDQKKAVVAYDFSVREYDADNKENRRIDVKNQKITIELPVALVDGGALRIYHINAGSKEEIVDFDISADRKTITFVAPSFSTYIVQYDAAPIDASELTGRVAVEFERVTDSEYDIVLKAEDTKKINGLLSADLTFALNIKPEESVSYTIEPGLRMELIDNGNGRYGFNYNGLSASSATGEAITIGKVKFDGYCENATFGVVDATTNVVNTTKLADSIVEKYDGTVLDITNAIDPLTLRVPSKTLDINIAFENTVADNVKAYQDMKVVISGGDLAESITVDLGSDATEINPTIASKTGSKISTAYAADKYTINVENVLTANRKYTITVSGAGYRTARYDVTMNTAKTLNFWNNVKDNAEVIEVGAAAATAKEATFLAGDIVKDNKINIYDLSAVVSYFGTETDVSAVSTYAKYDLNRDGVIDSKDIAYVLVSWGK